MLNYRNYAISAQTSPETPVQITNEAISNVISPSCAFFRAAYDQRSRKTTANLTSSKLLPNVNTDKNET